MLTMASIMEALMVICFGLSWPLNISKAWTEVVKWYVMFFYVLNLIMLTVGIVIYFRNVKLEKAH